MSAVSGDSNEPNVPGVKGTNAVGDGVFGEGKNNGVVGKTQTREHSGVFGQNGGGGVGVSGDGAIGVRGTGMIAVQGDGGFGDGAIGVRGTGFVAVQGDSFEGASIGVAGRIGVKGSSDLGTGVSGFSSAGVGVKGESREAAGIVGFTHVSSQSAIFGMNDAGGRAPENLGRPAGGGVWGHSNVAGGSGVIGSVDLAATNAAGVTGIGPVAGRFFGKVEVVENISAKDVEVRGGDCAEDFDIVNSESIDPGTVMVIGDSGSLQESAIEYDKRVAGVISGAGGYKPGIVLDKQHVHSDRRVPIALVGKVFCKVDALYSSIEVGDLLTTSSTPGHAMKVKDPIRGIGAVIGKALSPMPTGRGMIPVLVALQ